MKYLNQVLEYFDVSDKYRSYQIQLLNKFVGKNILEVGAGRGKIIETLSSDQSRKFTLLELDNFFYDYLHKNLKSDKVRIMKVKSNTLKEKFRTTSKFTDIRITSGYDDEKQLMSLLKDLKALKKKYAFIEFADKGYVDRTKKKLRRQEKIVATNTLSKKEQTALDKKLKQIGAKKKSSDKFSALKGIKV